MADARCHYCTRAAQEECPTCGRLYCAEHGEDVCLRCLSPEAATPSPAAYRGAILALAIGAAVAIYLVVSPPASQSSQDSARPLPTPTPPALQPTATPTPEMAATQATAAATVTPGGPATPTPTPGPEVHVVEPGDTLSAIADAYGLSVADLLSANPGLSEETPLQIGQEIIIPRR
jgi:LysM repeat protein